MSAASRLLLVALAAFAAAPAAAGAKDPGPLDRHRRQLGPERLLPGPHVDPAGRAVCFTGFFQGLWKTTPALRRTAGVPVAIPPAVLAAEGYNHIGDPTWDRGEGGRVILPLECYSPRLGNTCGTGRSAWPTRGPSPGATT